jgi:hypothetical protein
VTVVKKYIINSILILVVIILGIFAKFYFEEINFSKLNFVHRFVIERVLTEWENEMSALPSHERGIVEYSSLMNLLGTLERSFVERIFEINPIDLGFKGKFFTLDKPENLLRIESITLNRKGEKYETGIAYLPSHVNNDYELMMIEMENEIGKRLIVDSGYRSAGRQAYLFLFYLARSNNYSLRENAKIIAMPGYSEHGSPNNTAIDFINEDGINGYNENEKAEDFEILEEYKWLTKHGSKYNFYLSYPRDNRFGVSFEPWHWHWEMKK